MRYVTLLCTISLCAVLNAQPSSFVGMAAMTWYPDDTSSGKVLHIYDTRDVVVNAPQGNNWAINNLVNTASANPNDFKVARMGSVFGVTIDGTGNLYVAASGAYNLNGVEEGTAGSAGVYRVNAADWSVDDFITTVNAPSSSSTTQIPNMDCGIGNINWDQYNNQLFLTNFEDGKIYRCDMNGNILSKFDPFTADNGANGPASMGELTWGVAVNRDPQGNCRLYFSVFSAGGSPAPVPAPRDKNCIYSVALDANGDFTGTEQFEYQVEDFGSQWQPMGPGWVVSCLNFSSDGKLLVAERSQIGINSCSAHNSRVYILENSTGAWLLERYLHIGVIGLTDPVCANTSGGADWGFYDDDAAAGVNAGCEQMVWASSDAIKYDAYNPDGSQDKVYGLTGVKRSGNSQNSADPDYVYTTSYMIDLNQILNDQPKTYLGSCAVWTDCEYVFDSCDYGTVKLVNIFTPNKDGKNDFLAFNCIWTDGWQLQVFDRWGAEVYKSDNYQNDWDGGALVEGVYYYILTSPCDGQKFPAFCHLQRANP